MCAKKQYINQNFEIVLIGASAGGVKIFDIILPKIKKEFPIPIVIVQHLAAGSKNLITEYFNEKCQLNVKEVEEKEYLKSGTIYFAPSDYHLLIENKKYFALSVDNKINYSRPSIDVLLESAARVYKEKIICIILTGANSDGAKGAQYIYNLGGFVIVQDPETADSKTMPKSVISLKTYNEIMKPNDIVEFLNEFK